MSKPMGPPSFTKSATQDQIHIFPKHENFTSTKYCHPSCSPLHPRRGRRPSQKQWVAKDTSCHAPPAIDATPLHDINHIVYWYRDYLLVLKVEKVPDCIATKATRVMRGANQWPGATTTKFSCNHTPWGLTTFIRPKTGTAAQQCPGPAQSCNTVEIRKTMTWTPEHCKHGLAQWCNMEEIWKIISWTGEHGKHGTAHCKKWILGNGYLSSYS